MKFKELQGTSKNDLLKKQRELELELIKEQGVVAAGTAPKSPGHMRTIKKTLARIKHVLGNNEA